MQRLLESYTLKARKLIFVFSEQFSFPYEMCFVNKVNRTVLHCSSLHLEDVQQSRNILILK